MLVVVKTLLIFFLSFLITVYLVPLLNRVAFKFSIVDIPDGRLKNHKQPTPYLGGLAVYLGFLIASSLIMPFAHQFFLFILASTILLFVGLLDDLIVLTPGQKFFGQALAVLCYIKGGFYLKGLFFSHIWSIGISAFWLMLLINAFNLVDVMDGLATTLACAISCCYLLFAVLLGNYELALFMGAFCGSLFGFLLFNKPPACVYLGDAGSLFIGGFLASIPFTLSWREYSTCGYLAPLIVCAVPLIECGTLILVRSYKRIPFYRGTPDHYALFLLRKNWSKPAILIYSFAVTIECGVLALLLFLNIFSFVDVLCIVPFLLVWWYALLV